MTQDARAYIFYAGRLYGEYTYFINIPRLSDIGEEIYNGGYVYVSDRFGKGWYRMDKTPYPEDQVPNELKVILLLMGVT